MLVARAAQPHVAGFHGVLGPVQVECRRTPLHQPYLAVLVCPNRFMRSPRLLHALVHLQADVARFQHPGQELV